MSTVDVPVHEGIVFKEDIIVGLIVILLSFFILILNLLIIRIIYRDKELYNLNSYKFMAGLACSDSIQCVVHVVTGLFTCFQTTWHPLFAKFLGMFPCYIFYAVLTIVLSLNRLIAIASPNTDQWLFSRFAVKMWFLVSFVIAMFFATAVPACEVSRSRRREGERGAADLWLERT
uniref:7TM GPCR serpentine receptor class x (Srx) domain-containing protein n=1 Tax=Ditylenchus dipsaci TaxID=166011 RepID=A0A915E8T4_9BILA